MYCVKCGKEIKLNSKFCANCGEPVPQIKAGFLNDGTDKCEENTTNTESKQQVDCDNIVEENDEINGEKNIDESEDNAQLEFAEETPTNYTDNIPNKVKKPSKKLLAIVASVLVLGLLGVIFIINPFKNTKYMMSEIESTLSSFDEYILDDYKSEYDNIKNGVADQKEKKNYEKVKVLLAGTKDIKAKLQKGNNTIIDNMLKETKAIDTYRAYPDELKTIKGYEDKVKNYKNEDKFISARKVLTQYNQLLEAINYNYDNYDVSVNQIDYNSFPKVKVYLTIEDKNTNEVPKNLDPGFFYVSEQNANNNEFLKQKIQKVVQLDQEESLNINMVADVSGSMSGEPLEKAKYIMTDFLEEVQFNIKDKVELTAFSNGVRTCASFTDNKEFLKNEIYNLQTDDLTALYDALFAAVNTTAVQNGAKCVMAFTDGQDNFSKVTYDEVIEVAKRYSVPIFIIGIGNDMDTAKLENIATSTNGLYRQINDISDMSDFYQKIYKQNKEMYLLEYETQEKNNMIDERTLKIDVQTRKDGGGTNYAFTPRILNSTQSVLNSTDEISELIDNYLKNYVNAINNHDYSYIEDYIAPGGSIEKEVKPYIMKDIQEKLLSYEIINKENIDADTYIVTTRETYEVQNHDEPLHMRVLEGKYEVKKQSDGKWRNLNFADLYKVLSKINY
ncbi:TcaA NTF2-like domain-containing protein [Clostridium sp.]|uniref:TcaA NTF2-like domain-containing protein n=1 Tax=Clostridium sp. TaxID=1506 RepID=UPI003D6CB98A